ncbi:sulfite exporter TauE/SafE family protein [Sphingomonas radiodurans]|uniref:sulfite exporter TauE/SafE family protein n=1 Tax=Sphingomonas radiodurans TaxID=2890321 RepID=UPI001E345CFC|nr:sulfite exporter TauE/SafE family protein [Sphingomonas radiodurans]WBH15356.1 sulfite exporter TauE/SafE family protein [Sphingomonas radiodurans]
MDGYNPLYSLAGLMVGMLVGLTGVGGGSLMTPLLVIAFGFHPATAVGTDLLYASATKTVGSAVHGMRGTVDWAIVRRLATGSLPAALLTLLVLSRAGTTAKETGATIAVVLGVALVLTALATFFRARIVARVAPYFDGMSERRLATLTVMLGAILGVLVSFTSVGAGALGMTALLILYPLAPVNRLVGSDIAHAVPLTLIAGLGHWWLGSVDMMLLASLLAGSIPGIVLGSVIASRVTDRVLTPILATTLGLVGLKLIL